MIPDVVPRSRRGEALLRGLRDAVDQPPQELPLDDEGGFSLGALRIIVRATPTDGDPDYVTVFFQNGAAGGPLVPVAHLPSVG